MLRKIVFVLVILVSALLPAAALADNNITVQPLSFPVTLSDGNSYTIAGYLYYQGSYQNKPLQVLVHGGGYNHLYWDVPSINNNKYSYARYMAEEKYAVLAIDQLGTGQSSKPNGDFVTLAETASSIHQVIGQMRSGNNALGQAFNKIVLVGHSFGSINAITVQATYHDADALVITALGHVPHELPFTNEFLAELAQHEYFTLPLEVRSAVFYSAPAADPDVIAYDNANLVDQITRGQLFTTFAAIFNDSVGQVSGPVLVQLGQNDALWPASYAAGEAAYWASASSITVQSLPDVGHSFNTHLDNKRGWKQISQWLSDTVGRN